MRQSLEELCGLLHEQKNLLVNMIELSREERRVIISDEAANLEGIVRQEMRELSKLNAIEKKRMALHPVISSELGMNVDEITVGSIAESAEPDERKVLREIQAELLSLIKQHTELNMENRELIKAHIEYSETMLEMMVDSEDPLNNFYGGDGKAVYDRKKSTGFFDGHA